MKKHATALRAFTHEDDSFAKGQVILGMDAGQFADWSAPGVDMVRAATDAEVARARGEPVVKAPAKGKSRSRASALAPAAETPAEPVPTE